MRSLIMEQAAQLQSLSELGHHLVRAHFAVRWRLSELFEHNSLLMSALSHKGLVSNEDLLAQAQRQRPGKLLCTLCSDPYIACPLASALGGLAVQNLIAASRGFAGGHGFTLECFEETAHHFPEAAAAARKTDAEVLGEGEGAGEESRRKNSPRDGFLVLLQGVWQYNMLAESISCAMGLSVLQQFRAVSRAGCECMRSVHSGLGEGGWICGRAIVAGKAVNKPSCRGAEAFREEGLLRKGGPRLRHLAEERDKVAVMEPAATGPEDAMGQALAVLQHPWQDVALAETLKTCMGDAGISSFRMISRGGLECMRSAAKLRRRGQLEELRPPRAPAPGAVSTGGQRSHLSEQESQILVHVPDRFLRFCRALLRRCEAAPLRQPRERGSSPQGQAKLVLLNNLTKRPDLNGAIGKVAGGSREKGSRATVELPGGLTIRVSWSKCLPIKTSKTSSRSRWHQHRRCELKLASPAVLREAPVEMCVFAAKTPTREVVACLRLLCASNFSMASALIHDTLAATGKIFVCGGVDRTAVLGIVECFDLQSNRWTDPPPPAMKQPRGGAAWCKSGGYFWVSCGSGDGAGRLNSLERLDPWTGEWKVMPPMKMARVYACMVSVEGRLYVCGGHAQCNQPIAAVERFDPVIRVWKEVSSMLEKRTVPMAVVADGRMYVYGGVDQDFLNSLECYDPSLEFWQRLPPMAHCRSHAGSALAKGCLYVCGGIGGPRGKTGTKPEQLQVAERYSIERSRWEELPAMCCGRAHNSVVVRGDILFNCGGCSTGKPSVEALDLRVLDAWEVVGPPLIQEWTFGMVTAAAEHIYVLGGRSKRAERDSQQTGDALLNSVVRYSTSSHIWEELPPMQHARALALVFHTCL